MKTKLKTILCVAASVSGVAGLAYAADTQTTPHVKTANITVSITGVRHMKGTVLAGLYNSKTGYKAHTALQNVTAGVDGETLSRPLILSFKHIPSGEYAIRVFHDVNDNGTLDVNGYGMPTEPYAFSNNAKGMMGPAKWSKAKFSVSGTTSHTIKLN